jgi:hypothetical protein
MSQSTVILNELIVMPKSKPLPPLEELNRRYYVDPTSPSGLRNKISLCNRAPAHAVAGSLSTCGNWRVKIGGKFYTVHRIIAALIFEGDPGHNEVDHLDGNSSNNSPENLKLVNKSMNLHNANVRRDSKTGVKGVRYVKGRKSPYLAGIVCRGKRYHLGSFKTLEEAKAARDQAEFDLGVHAGFWNLSLIT